MKLTVINQTEGTHWRPKTRADCIDGPRPCPYVGCRHHLSITVKGKSIANSGKYSAGRSLGADVHSEAAFDAWSNRTVDLISKSTMTCALDVVDKHQDEPASLSQIGGYLNASHERIRQIEASALRRIRKSKHADALGDVLASVNTIEHRSTPLQRAQELVPLNHGDTAGMRYAKAVTGPRMPRVLRYVGIGSRVANANGSRGDGPDSEGLSMRNHVAGID